ncbi:MAG: GAF domain-containing protein [Bacteroidota bacterium]|nr:GAF domain-containing protein [Bacteroidota bacterium]
MKLNLNLKNKMQLYLIGISVIIYIAAIGYISINAQNNTYKDAINLVDAYSEKYANKIQGEFNQNIAVVRTLAKSYETYKDLPHEEWNNLNMHITDKVFRDNPAFYNIWDSWELKQIDSTWKKPYGRIANEHFLDEGTYKSSQKIRSLDGDPEIYAHIKTESKELILPIYADVFANNKSERKIMTSLVSPIMVDATFIGMVGADITLDSFQKIIEKIKLKQFGNSFAFLLSHNAKYAGHPNKEKLNTKAKFSTELEGEIDIIKLLNKNTQFSLTTKDENGKTNYISFSPIEIGRTGTSWYIGVSVPLNSIMEEADKNFFISIMIGFFGILFLSILVYFITKNISDPIAKITESLKQLALGNTKNKMTINIDSGDEIGEIANALNESVIGIKKKTEFADHIRNGQLDYNFELLSENDSLGMSLLNMRDSLVKAQKDEKLRKIEDEKRQWINEGLAKFADILRSNNENLDLLSNIVLKELVYYLKANQGGLFLINDNDDSKEKFLEQQATFAYDRKRFVDKKLKLKDSIIGTCALEKESIYMTDIPDEYIQITSGLGDANPNSLLLVPLKLENEVYGVIEIASFNEFEKYEIDFVEKVSQNIASTLSAVKMHVKTNELLEKSQQQAEELSAQEEEMRQNMEELQATQEESTRKTSEMGGLVHALNIAAFIIEYDINGFITSVNDKYLNLLKLNKDEVIGSHHSDKMEFDAEQKEQYDKFWNELKLGKTKKETTKAKIGNRTFVFLETYTPIFDEDGQVERILKISNEISDFEKSKFL